MALLQKESKHGETVVQKGNEGLLYVTLVDKHTAEEKSGTVCDNGYTFNMRATRLFCQKMGYLVDEGAWGKHANFRYVLEYVFFGKIDF